jgi:hypothetical protein
LRKEANNMAKKLYRFPNAKMALYASEKAMTDMCTAIEREILAKYGGEYVVGFEPFPSKIEGYQMHGETLCYEVSVHVKRL